MKYRAAFFCEHANECPAASGPVHCLCPLDCACREHMCDPNRAPSGVLSQEPEVWRVGRTLGRTLYRNGVFVGTMDTVELADAVVERMNRR